MQKAQTKSKLLFPYKESITIQTFRGLDSTKKKEDDNTCIHDNKNLYIYIKIKQM